MPLNIESEDGRQILANGCDQTDGHSEIDSQAEEKVLGINVKLLNIILLGLGFMFSIGAYQTTAIAQTVVINSVHDEQFDGTPTMGYVCMGINCATQAVATLLGPSLVALIGPKSTIVTGAVCISLYVACFLRPLAVTLYVGSAVLGTGVGLVWLVQGYFVMANSTHLTMGRNTGIFWALYQSSLISGNLFYYAVMYGKDTINDGTRMIVFWPLLGVAIVGVVVFSLLRHPWTKPIYTGDEPDDLEFRTPLKALGDTLRLGLTRRMWILWPLFMYIGMELTFWVSVYGTSLGYTLRFGTVRQALVGLSGVFVGIGEIVAGIVMGLLGKWTHRNGRDPAVVCALIIHIACFYLVLINLPAESPLSETQDTSLINPNQYVAMFCSFLLGCGDAVWNNQLISFLGVSYRSQTVTAFAVYQFWMSIGNTVSSFYSTALALPFQLLLLVLTATAAAWGFFTEEWKSHSTKNSIQ
ncbi:UNC93-like protein MFSD11 [Hypsibius exemplaris]|uniref:UNC93-like protein MFSD11 n=1 Tax=Hypsibius exemplaris TaxID=2072580 RepID=A0A1W0WYI2_HYPEX|nr:UNC93-like protein MFSD11 [Hypsibius exemplaris]